MSRNKGHSIWASAVRLALLFTIYASPHQAQAPDANASSTATSLTWTSDAVAPGHFVAVHGRRSLLMGYPEKGLEIWGYPFQILSEYQVGFKAEGSTAVTDGRLLLRRVDYRPDSVIRTYIGPDFLVREKLFVPLDQAAAIISYQVEGIRKVDLEIRFQPVLNLMWPGALGGQYTRWNTEADKTSKASGAVMPGFIIAEPERGYSAAIGSPELISHDDTVNSTVRESGYRFALRPNAAKPDAAATATVYVALNEAGAKDPSALLSSLPGQVAQLERDAAAHYAALEHNAIRIRTPDEEINRGLAWSVVALDQAWVCNPLLGCGLVAGYGPSRDARRPQYAWFFGGDGLVATNALIAAGEYSRAREELAFVQKFQDSKSGMIWHELSQSAGLIDWSKFPYMYVHVDISFDYLATQARYLHATGDVEFVKAHWASIEAAYRYCRSQIQESDHLPHIPSDKEASDEQHRPADDLGLAASWLSAAAGYAELATATGHAEQAAEALQQAHLTRQSIPRHYWNADKQFWFDGHTASGVPIYREAAGPTHLLAQSVFPDAQQNSVLDRIASADFQTDWGTREVAASSHDYNPYSYGAGSISALGTSAIATTFWQAHRPETAQGLWNGIMQWNHLDSPGHIHEVLAGNFFHEETESVPEQTWSSAGLLDCTVRGLLGLEIDGGANSLRLAPHVPPEWKKLSVDNIRLPHSTLAVTITQSDTALDLAIRNDGAATSLTFEPRIPLGARLLSATLNEAKLNATVQTFPGDQHAKVTLAIPPGSSHCRIRYTGGVALLLPPVALHVGDTSSQLKIVQVKLEQRILSIDADMPSGGGSHFRIRTPWTIASHEGVAISALPGDEYELTLPAPTGAELMGPTGYAHARCRLVFAARAN